MKLPYSAKKSLGQNFLIDKNIIDKIIKVGNIDSKKNIIEIGPGYGSLTHSLSDNNPSTLLAIEKDQKIYTILKNSFNDHKNVKIINDDILNFISKNKFKKRVIVFGNLPYSISTQILVNFIVLKKWPPWYEKLIFMFQKEVADRILAKENTKNFNRLSVLSNWRLDIKKHFNISKNCFYPKPKVDSTLLSFFPKKKNLYNLKNPKNLEIITRHLFSNRRKMINKSFNKLFGKNSYISHSIGIKLNKRPEEISNEMYYKIAVMYEKLFD
jgi:16S rRNA (adenine1518-N6/adenine1519-N6)-dimethyltransferase